MKKHFFIFFLLAIACGTLKAQESFSDKIKKAFSLVGHWEIIKMDVIRASTLTNPGTVPEATMGTVSVLISSELGSYGSFDVAPGGNINGSGEAQYNYHVSAGSTAMSVPMTNMVLPVGASAVMEGDDGVRKFSITGSADLVNRTIKLNAFKAEGSGLKMMIHPGNKSFNASLWPPMTNVESKVLITGSSLLLRATGVLSGIKVSFEAVKYVDLASLFNSIEDMVKNGTNGSNGSNGINGSNGNNGNNGNNSTNNSNNTNSSNGNNNNNNNNTNNNGSNNNKGPQALIAGTVSVNAGGTAVVIFKVPQASSNYAISLTAMNGGNSLPPTVTFSDKTNLGFKVNAAKNGATNGAVKVDWLVTPYTN